MLRRKSFFVHLRFQNAVLVRELLQLKVNCFCIVAVESGNLLQRARIRSVQDVPLGRWIRAANPPTF